jgi:hypothetical protein
MAELLVLDPGEVADDDRTELDITKFVGPEGPDFGEAVIEQVLADVQFGSVPIDQRIPLREIHIPLILAAGDGFTFEEIRSAVQAKAALFQQEGGWLKRETAIGMLFADVISASLHLGASSVAAWGFADADAVLNITAIPDFYELEEELTATGGNTGNGEWIGLIDEVRGNYPSRLRVVATEGSNKDQLGLLAALRSRHYSPDATAKSVYEAEALKPLDAATVITHSGASGGSVVKHPGLSTQWTPVAEMRLADGTYLTHTGSVRIRVRVYSANGPAVRLRLIYNIGSMEFPVENNDDAKPIPGTNNFYWIDLGAARLDAVPIPPHRWTGQIQAAGAVGGESVEIDKVSIEAFDEGHAVLRATPTSRGGFTSYALRDEFNQTAGTLSGKVLASTGAFSGPLSPGTMASVDIGSPAVHWGAGLTGGDVNNAKVSDDVRAGLVTTLAPGQYSHWLWASNFGGSIVPSGATITGIKVEVERQNVADDVVDYSARIVKGGAIAGAERRQGFDWAFGADAYVTYGGEADLWGTTWTVAEINSGTFGFALSAQNRDPSGYAVPYVDHIRLTVYYTLSGGGTWLKAGGSGADYSVVAGTTHDLERTAVSDTAGIENGCIELASTQTFTDTALQFTTKSSSDTGDARRGGVLRYTATSSFLLVDVQPSTGNLTITRRLSSANTVLFQQAFPYLQRAGPFTVTVLLGGGFMIYVFVDGVMFAVLSDGGLAFMPNGKVGLWDLKTTSTAETRSYDNFAAWVPTFDAVVRANLSAELRTDGTFREVAGGGAYRPTQPPIGNLLRMPPGFQGRSVELLLRSSQGDFDQLPDLALGALSTRVFYNASWLFLPDPTN